MSELANLDLWPTDITDVTIVWPAAILKEQAALLGSKTKHLLEGRVDTTGSGDGFTHRFSIVVPRLSNYTYELLSVDHGVKIFPLFVSRTEGPTQKLETEEAFIEWLRSALSSEETKRVIGTLLGLAQSSAAQ
jgi:hypothetical protein